MRARAFQDWAQLEPQTVVSTQIHRPLEHSHWLYAFGVWLYNWIQRTAPILHQVYYNFLEIVPVVRTSKPLGAPKFHDVLLRTRPDVLLSVHDSLNHGFFEYAKVVLGEQVCCVTYCGELYGGYGFSRHWVNPAADLFIGAVPEASAAAVRWGMAPEKTVTGGFLLRRQFYGPAPDEAARRAYVRDQLQFDPDEFILLLSASSRGAHNHVRFLEALQRHHPGLAVVLLCGKSPQSREEVEAWARSNPQARVRILAHNTNVAHVMRCVSAIVARPGTGTISEAILSGCPLLLNCLGGVMPQEYITVKYCRQHGLAEEVRNPDYLVRLVGQWKRHPELPAAIRQAMKEACPPSHPREIVRTIAALALKAQSGAATALPIIEAARIAPPAAPGAPGKIRPPQPAAADSP